VLCPHGTLSHSLLPPEGIIGAKVRVYSLYCLCALGCPQNMFCHCPPHINPDVGKINPETGDTPTQGQRGTGKLERFVRFHKEEFTGYAFSRLLFAGNSKSLKSTQATFRECQSKCQCERREPIKELHEQQPDEPREQRRRRRRSNKVEFNKHKRDAYR
jgi:hypothetical protein